MPVVPRLRNAALPTRALPRGPFSDICIQIATPDPSLALFFSFIMYYPLIRYAFYLFIVVIVCALFLEHKL